MSTPILSIGMIVKNEIRCLERCLKALQPLRDAIACELVIADTGSTDGTREVAEQYADIVFDFQWVNDFSAARNAVMDRCSGQWYMSVDADEYLDPEITDLVAFLTGENSKKYLVACYNIRNYTKRDMTGVAQSFPATRLIRMDTGERFTGTIHESWALATKVSVFHLGRTLFHHDGYAYETMEQCEAKMDRNMQLLRKVLEKEPENIRCINQCIESTYAFPEEREKYVKQGMTVLMEKEGYCKNPFAAPLCRSAIRVAAQNNLPQLQEWLAFTQKHFSKDKFYKIDVCYCMANMLVEQEQYEECLCWCKDYLKNQADLEAEGENALLQAQTASTIWFCNSVFVQWILCIKIQCLCQLGRLEEAAAKLHTITMPWYEGDFWKKLFVKCMFLMTEFPDVQEVAAKLIREIVEDQTEEHRELRGKWLEVCDKFFVQKEPKWRLFCKVDGDLGISAQIMDKQGENLNPLLNQIQNWDLVPDEIICHSIRQGVTLPRSFYLRSWEKTRKYMVIITKRVDHSVIMEWLENNIDHDVFLQLQFSYELYLAIIRSHDWAQYRDSARLCRAFLKIQQQYLHQLYHPTMLEDEEKRFALPSIHHFSCLLEAAYKKQQDGDLLGWTVMLKKALKVAPVMKKMVEFLIDNPPERPQDHELKELANKVKTLLEQYPENDPAILAIKQSVIYQKVAHLIGNQNAPAEI